MVDGWRAAGQTSKNLVHNTRNQNCDVSVDSIMFMSPTSHDGAFRQPCIDHVHPSS